MSEKTDPQRPPSPSSGAARMEKIVSLSKRRGFIFQSSEIYGGLNGCWDYGPLGVEMLRNVKEAWWRAMTYRTDIEGLDASILMHPKVWEASGHVQNFSDPMVDCKSCKSRFRVDHLFSEMSEKKLQAIGKHLNIDHREHTKETLAEYLLMRVDQDDTLFPVLVEQELVICPNCGTKKSLTSPR